MLSGFKAFLGYIFYGFLILLLGALLYQVSLLNNEVSFDLWGFVVYTTEGVLLAILIVFGYLLFKSISVLFKAKYWLLNIKQKISNALSAFKKSSVKISEADILHQIYELKLKKSYKQGLKLTTEYLNFSYKIIFWHLFFLLKLKQNKEFLNLFLQKQCGDGIKLFTLIYLKTRFSPFKSRFLKNLYLENTDSQVCNYIYSSHLFKKGKFKEAKVILNDFLVNKKILMTDIKTSLYMNILAIKIEKAIWGEGANAFILEYEENIQSYYAKKK